MADWKKYLADKEPVIFKKKKTTGPGCKRNKIGKNRLGTCSFNDKDTCIYCSRPRRKETRFDIKTNTLTVKYFE